MQRCLGAVDGFLRHGAQHLVLLIYEYDVFLSFVGGYNPGGSFWPHSSCAGLAV